MKIFRLLPALILTVAACSDKGQKAEMQYSFTLENTSITLRAGDSAKLGIRSVIDGISFGSYDFTQDKLLRKLRLHPGQAETRILLLRRGNSDGGC